VSAVLTVATVALVGLTVVAVLAAPWLFALYGADEEVRDAGVPLLRLFLPQILFYGWMALGAAVLNARRRFAVPAFAPILNNVVVCGALVAFGLRFGAEADTSSVVDDTTGLLLLGLGTTLGIVAMTVPLWPAMRAAGLRWRWRFRPRDPAVTTVVRRSGWTLGYVAANQVGLAVMLAVSGRTLEGLPSAYTYAFIFFQLPHGLIAVSLMTTFVPALSSAWRNGDVERYRTGFDRGLRLLWTGVVPATVVLAVAAHPIAGLLDRGAFDDAAAARTGDVLAMMALGLPGFSAYLFALRGFYAQGDTKTPFLLNLVENGVQVALTIALVPTLDRAGTALGIAYAVAYSLAAVLSLGVLTRRVPRIVDRRLVASTLRLALCAAAGVVAGLALRGLLDSDSDVVEALALAGGAAAAFLAAAAVLRVAEVRELVLAVTGRDRQT
jgi:putative peptidoglycan lipid II flippase